MSGAEDDDRVRRTRKLRDAWRRAQHSEEDAPAALDSNDQIRAEAPGDLEGRRRADELEREIRRSKRQD